MSYEIIVGDALTCLREMEARSVQTCITSPPYFGLRDYGNDAQIGLEATPDEYVAKLVEVFGEVKRVLRDDGTLWLNLGDSYNNTSSNANGTASTTVTGGRHDRLPGRRTMLPSAECKPKDLLGIPWMAAFALRSGGWYLRSEIIWHKPYGMPESVLDRPVRSHEQVFLLAKRPRYYYDYASIQEPDKGTDHQRRVLDGQPSLDPSGGLHRSHSGLRTVVGRNGTGARKRSVWRVGNQPYAEAHFATFPPKLIEPMVLAGCPRGGVVLDPFVGSGTTLQVAVAHGRSAIGIELNPDYAELARRRVAGVTPSMFDSVPA